MLNCTNAEEPELKKKIADVLPPSFSSCTKNTDFGKYVCDFKRD